MQHLEFFLYVTMRLIQFFIFLTAQLLIDELYKTFLARKVIPNILYMEFLKGRKINKRS